MTLVDVLPHVTASLNGLAGLMAVTGVWLIKTGRRQAHRAVMTGAMAVSAVFLATYLLHHFLHPLHEFPGIGAVRPLYFTLLVSHVALAVIVTPMIIVTFLRARAGWATGLLERHKALARWTFPIWLYVSVTGVLVYWLLFHVYV
jgi:uncharacterized membrane protein YozB (DUF420 family)